MCVLIEKRVSADDQSHLTVAAGPAAGRHLIAGKIQAVGGGLIALQRQLGSQPAGLAGVLQNTLGGALDELHAYALDKVSGGAV